MLRHCSGFVSGSADKEIKFWEWAIVEQDGAQARQLTVNNTRTLKMTDEVLCVRISPNGMLRCAMLLRPFGLAVQKMLLRHFLTVAKSSQSMCRA